MTFDLGAMGADMQAWEVPAPPTDNIPRWLTEDYEGSEKDIASDVYAAVYWNARAKMVKDAVAKGEPIPDANDIMVKSKEMSMALLQSALQARSSGEALNRASIYLMWKIEKTGAFRLDPNEFDTIGEFLVNRIAGLDDSSGELSDLKFLLEKFFPMIESMKSPDWSVEKLLAIKDHWSKARAAVPFLRQATSMYLDSQQTIEHELKIKNNLVSRMKGWQKNREDRGEADTDEYKETATKIESTVAEISKLEETKGAQIEAASKEWGDKVTLALNVIADPAVKPWGNPGENTVKSALFGGMDKAKLFWGMWTALPGRSVFLMILPSDLDRAVQTALSTITEFHITDPTVMHAEMLAAVKENPFE